MAAQKTIATLKPGSNRSKDFQIFNSGDTLFLSYFELDFKTEQYVHRAAYIFPNGVSENIFFKDIPLLAWCGFETVNGGFYHYYIEDRKKGTSVVKAFYLNRGQNARSFLEGEITIPEEIVGVIPSKGLTIITRNTTKNTIRLYKLHQFRQVSAEEYLLPNEFSLVGANDFQLITSTTGWPSEAHKKTKIYLTDGELLITADVQSGTGIISYNLMKREMPRVIIPEFQDSPSNSFLCGPLLFRLVVTKGGFTVKVFKNDDGTLIFEKELRKEEANDEVKVYSRSGEDLTSHDEKFRRMTKFLWITGPTIVAHEMPSGKYNVTIGTYYKMKKGFGTPGTIMNPTAILLTLALTSALQQLKKESYGGHYFHCTFENNNLNFQKDPGLIFRKLDDCEINYKARGIEFEDIFVVSIDKAYVIARNKKSKSIEVIRIAND